MAIPKNDLKKRRWFKMNVTKFRPGPGRPRPDKSVFQFCADRKTCPSLAEVREVYDLCRDIKNRDHRDAIYVMNNLDPQTVPKYFETVEHLETCWKAKYEGSRTSTSYLIEHLEKCFRI
jgi:hypothetical protein